MAEGVGLNPSDWFILYSEGLGNHPDAAGNNWSVTLNGGKQIDYIQRKMKDSVRNAIKDGGSKFSVILNVTADGLFKSQQDGGNTCYVTCMMRIGSDLTNDNHRMWCRSSRYSLVPGGNSWDIPIDRSQWGNVVGQMPSSDKWSEMLNKAEYIGLTFGGINDFGHGVKMQSGTGTIGCLDFKAY